MKNFKIKNAKIIGCSEISENLCLYCKDGKIEKIAPDCNADIPTIDAKGLYLSPGFIDLHIHGLLGKCVDNGVEDYVQISSDLPRFGVSGYLPTITPRKPGDDSDYLEMVAKAKTNGAEVLGFHLEGPFLCITGALPREALGSADINRVKNLQQAALPYKAIFSISPEFEDIETLLPTMTKNNTPAFITHTAANVEQTLRAINLGARHATHFYDVFSVPPVSEPGVRPCGAVEAICASDKTSVDFILDGEHVDPIAVKMALKCKGQNGVCLVSDAAPVAGAEPGVYDFAGKKVQIKKKGSPARIVESGSLAGSGLTMDRAVANAVKMLDADICLAVKMASTNPAAVLGIDNVKGKIKEGYDCDITLFDDKFQVMATWVNGIQKFNNLTNGEK